MEKKLHKGTTIPGRSPRVDVHLPTIREADPREKPRRRGGREGLARTAQWSLSGETELSGGGRQGKEEGANSGKACEREDSKPMWKNVRKDFAKGEG